QPNSPSTYYTLSLHDALPIYVINERFGTDFTDSDQLFFDQIIEAAIEDGSLREAAAVNPEEKFALLFSSLLETLFIERMEQNEEDRKSTRLNSSHVKISYAVF